MADSILVRDLELTLNEAKLLESAMLRLIDENMRIPDIDDYELRSDEWEALYLKILMALWDTVESQGKTPAQSWFFENEIKPLLVAFDINAMTGNEPTGVILKAKLGHALVWFSERRLSEEAPELAKPLITEETTYERHAAKSDAEGHTINDTNT